MKASRILAPGKFEIIDIEPTKPGVGEVAVRPMYLSICGSDIFHLHYLTPEDYPEGPGSSGHEMVGVVAAVGEGVKGINEGDLTLTLALDHTAMTEWYISDAENVLKLPEGRALEDLVLAQQLGTVIYACRRLPNMIGTTAVVIGQGSAGLFWDAMLRRLGARRIIAFDLEEARVEAALRLGADYAYVNPKEDPIDVVEKITGGQMADIVIEAAGEVDSINLAPRLVREKGIIYLFGVPRSREFVFDYWNYYRTYAETLTSGAAMTEPGKGSFHMALDLIAGRDISVDGIITHRFPFAELGRAYETARTRVEGSVKVLVEMPAATG